MLHKFCVLTMALMTNLTMTACDVPDDVAVTSKQSSEGGSEDPTGATVEYTTGEAGSTTDTDGEHGSGVCEPTCSLPPAPAVCQNDLSGAGDFSIRFGIETSLMGAKAVELLSQRQVCSNQYASGVGGWWSLRLNSNGQLNIETSGSSFPTYAMTRGSTDLRDGQPHAVLVQRVNGVVSMYVDCVEEALAFGGDSNQGHHPVTFGTMVPTLADSDPCTGLDGTVPIDAPLTDVCVSLP